MSMNILVTGAAGYLGSILCEHLLNTGFFVTAVDNLLFGQTSLFHLCANPRFNFVRADVRDTGTMTRLMSNADIIIPLAALAGAGACDRDPSAATAINFDSIRELNRLRSSQQLVIYPTTNSIYGTQSGVAHCTEQTPLEPISLYGRTKVDAEKELLEADNTITLRLATVFGVSPRMRIDLLVNHFVYAAVTDGYIVIFEKDFNRNYIHIRDVADCFLHCIKNADAMTGKPYNAGLDDTNLSKQELALTIKRYLPQFYIHFAEVGTDSDKRNYIVSNQRLKKAGFEARRFLEDGIGELIKCYAMYPRHAMKNI
ncbi:MAG: NAD(P)-dependent oxidoreductase [Desulfobacteraceae bacterium]|nr:NAD(P)-dependent oxidoreductase [Desulfobacteraceae bacterium]